MAQANASIATSFLSRRDGPWLLPTNRKVRNLVSISLRNISIAPTSPTRRRGKTIDDDALPQTLRSPAKSIALREQQALGHSRSSSDLKAVVEQAIVDGEDNGGSKIENGSPVTRKQRVNTSALDGESPRRPGFRRMRRRSTMDWANATPQRRQERLEDVIKERMTDVFFTLHVKGVEGPIYISEVVEMTMNPTFGHIDWAACSPGVTRLDQLTVRFWLRGGRVPAWRQLLQIKLELPRLHYIGKSLDHLGRRLSTNAVLFHMTDGVYTDLTGALSDFSFLGPEIRSPTSATHRTLPTSSFDALLRLAKLDDSIQDALAVRDQIASDLESLLLSHRAALSERDQVTEAEDRLKTVEFAKKIVEKQLEKARSQKSERVISLRSRRQLMYSGRSSEKTESVNMVQFQPQMPSIRAEHIVRQKAIQSQRRRVCEDLQQCFPIQPLTGKTLAFSVGHLHLPNAEDLDSESPETVSAALGHVAQMLQLLSFYLKQPLPYPVQPRGSTSTVLDSVSILKTNAFLNSPGAEQKLRTYPLFSKGMPRFRFEYAVFLINQNIRILLESTFDVRVLDIRQTVPNLKYLLYVATAGEGELPARKAGGIRGLLRAPALERTNSNGSTSSNFSGITLHGNGKPRAGAVERLKEISGKG